MGPSKSRIKLYTLSTCSHCMRTKRFFKDNGIGIPRQALQKLGRPFEQVESQLTKRHQGSGLGLAIAKSLVELHGGAMRIRSRLGRGTLVMVRLPADAAVAMPLQRIEAAA